MDGTRDASEIIPGGCGCCFNYRAPQHVLGKRLCRRNPARRAGKPPHKVALATPSSSICRLITADQTAQHTPHAASVSYACKARVLELASRFKTDQGVVGGRLGHGIIASCAILGLVGTATPRLGRECVRREEHIKHVGVVVVSSQEPVYCASSFFFSVILPVQLDSIRYRQCRCLPPSPVSPTQRTVSLFLRIQTDDNIKQKKKMPASRNVLSALAAAAAVGKARAAFGPAFSTGPTSDDTYIVESWATLTLPSAPSDNSGDLSLWVGMGTSAGDLIQSIAENYAESDWSVYAYTLVSTSDSTQTVVQADGSTADAGVDITFHYKYDESTGNYTQTVYKAGTVVSTLSTSDGQAEGWGSAVECAAEDCGTVPSHQWSNVSIILSGADSAYSDTLSLGTDVDASMSSSDGGITWEVGSISIPCWSFTDEAICDESSSSSSSSGSTSTSSSAAAVSSSPSNTGSYGASPSGASSGSGSSYEPSSPESSGTPTSASYGSQPTGAYGSGSESEGGSPTWDSSSSSPTGGWGSYGGGSSTWDSAGSQSSDASFGGYSDDSQPAWARSRIARPNGPSKN